jgi:hypothetical protein
MRKLIFVVMVAAVAMSAGCSSFNLNDIGDLYSGYKERKEAEKERERQAAEEERRQAEEAERAANEALLAIPHRNWEKQPDWSLCAGAPKTLYPGATYKIWWNGPKPGGSWRFKYTGGGQGLYKRYEYEEDGSVSGTSDVWAVPGVKSAQVGKAGEQDDAGRWIRWFTWPRGVGDHAQKPIDGAHLALTEHDDHYVSGMLKLRSAKASRPGAWFVVTDRSGKELARKRIYDPEVRQE